MRGMKFTLLIFQPVIKAFLFVFVSQVMWQFKKEEDLFQIQAHLWMEVLLKFTQV